MGQEQEIIDLLRRRDNAGADALLAHYGPLMRYVIAPILPDPQDQEECLSAAVLRVWDKIDLFDPRLGGWKSWLTAVCRNAALNHRRRSAGDGTEPLSDDLPAPEPTPEEQLLRQERFEELTRALRRLSQRDQVLFYRKYYYLQSTAQIAAETGTTERAVEGRLYRLRKRLRQALGGDGDE